MAMKRILLKDLKVADLRKELEERNVESSGNKIDLKQKLRNVLAEEGEDPDSFLFEVPGVIDTDALLELMGQNFQNILEKLEENSRALKERIDQIEESTRSFKVNIGEELKNLEEEIGDIKTQVAALQTTKSSRLFDSNEDTAKSNNIQSTLETEVVRIHIKVPEFDGKSSWTNYYRQFEAAAKANQWTATEKVLALTLALRGEATDILQTVSSQDDYNVLVKRLELRYGQTQLEHVYHSQLKNRIQKQNESLQEFEADVDRLARLAYPATPDNVLERLAIQAFLDGLRDHEIRQALILARPDKLVDALARALEIEAAKYTSTRGLVRVQRMEASSEEATIDEAVVRRIVNEMFPAKRQLRCWNCGKLGHVRSRCKQKTEVSEEKQLRCWDCGKLGHVRSRCEKNTDQQVSYPTTEN